ncbi:acetyl-coenzyme A synthetase N-terminal domain-containing protein [Actinomycetospora sp. NBRC 106378]|uniref:acetyl-coenzyme A synthetase N-terminal domain-containing protein n=1 Tax=Actinomycetospora sp. NBRC 106378 TaxID=3032208 RepID=UPI00331A6351
MSGDTQAELSEAAYLQSMTDPEGFWRDAAGLTDWCTEPETIMRSSAPQSSRWFAGVLRSQGVGKGDRGSSTCRWSRGRDRPRSLAPASARCTVWCSAGSPRGSSPSAMTTPVQRRSCPTRAASRAGTSSSASRCWPPWPS